MSLGTKTLIYTYNQNGVPVPDSQVGKKGGLKRCPPSFLPLTLTKAISKIKK